MNQQIKWKVDGDQQAVHVSVQRDLVLTPTNFSLAFDTVEVIYCQMLTARIQRRQQAQQRVLKAT